MTENNFEVALVKEHCPICAKETGSPIFMNTQLSRKAAREVKELDGKHVWADSPCEECAEMKDKAFIFVVCDLDKSEDQQNPYRTGEIMGIKKEKAEEMFAPEFLTKGMAYVHYLDAQQMGLPTKYQP